MLRDLTHNTQVKHLLLPQDISADTWSNYVDLSGWESATFVVTNNTLTGADADNYITPTLYEASETPASTSSYTAVDTGDMIDSFSAINDTITTSTQSVGYNGGKRYVCVKLEETSTGVSAGNWSIHVVLARPRNAPADTAPTTGAVS